MRPTKPRSRFTAFAKYVAHWSGRPIAFVLASLTIIVWALTGPVFGFSDTWQLVINTGTTVITFLMVFLIQNTQNRDSEAIQVKLDEIIRSIGNARNELLDLEELEEDDLDEIKRVYEDMAEKARGERHAARREKRR
ncbi:MAG TPA: low affinity iron permease family protein [Vicinamibacterales bacterium]|nr:low affinity iron permease family protein [Vicinamibacterales bacterium]